MSVRSRIAIKEKDGRYKSINCHSDGQLSYNGEILYRHYKDPLKIELLMNLGDLSSLGKSIYPDKNKTHNFNNRQDDVCVSYYRDRNEEKLRLEMSKTKEDLIKSVSSSDEDYLYLFENGSWYVANTMSKDYTSISLTDLESELLEHNVIDQPVLGTEYYIDELVTELVNYARESDPYEYRDLYSSDEDAFNSIKRSLVTVSDIDSTIEWICGDINHYASENDMSFKDTYNNFKTACALLYKLNQYSKVLEYDNDLDKEL